MVGCSNGTTTPVNATIIKIVDDNSSMGCAGTNKRTIFQTEHGNVSYMCGEYGDVGAKVKGYWVEGHWDGISNRFHLTN
jgi:hypothetical protein